MPSSPASVTVLGAGYVGLITAVGLAELGHTVELVETAPGRLASLQRDAVPIYEAGLQPAFEQQTAAGRLTVAGAPTDANGIVMVCVGTPISDDGRSDLAQLKAALHDLDSMVSDETILVIRSTLPVGATRRLGEWTSVPTTRIFTNPEFLREGTALADFRAPSRVVIGRFQNADEGALAKVLGLYAAVDAPVEVVDVTASEMIKNGANAFLALKLSFVNELAALAEEMGTDVGHVLRGIGSDPRIGSRYMQPGLGFGGSCLPKELQTLAVAGRSVGLTMHVTTAAAQANIALQERFAERLAAMIGGFEGRRIGLLGLAFKAGTDDVRDSPALRLAGSMLAGGAEVVAFDPAAAANASRVLPNLTIVDRAEDVFPDADVVVIGTEWPEFATLPYAALRGQMAHAVIADGRRIVDAPALRELGYRVVTIGTSEDYASIALARSASA